MLRWQKRLIAGEAFESAAFIDVTGDGVLDIVSGAFWYEGPDFTLRHTITDVKRVGDYYDDFGTIALDVTGTGTPDLVTGAWFGEALRWREHPSDHVSTWTEREIAVVGPIEQPQSWDVDGDGEREIVPNTPSGPLRVVKLRRGETPAWEVAQLWDGPQGHGLGYGDVSGSGRGDFVFSHGWLERLPDGAWEFRDEFDLGQTASVPIVVADVTGNGRGDLLVGNGHGYGLDWWEQGADASGRRTWTRHAIDDTVSQCHAMRWVDIDGDSLPELVTGKRWHAHPQGDAGNDDDPGAWYYKWNGKGFDKHVIAEGPRESASVSASTSICETSPATATPTSSRRARTACGC